MGAASPVPHFGRGVLAHVAVGYKYHVWIALFDGAKECQVICHIVRLPAVLTTEKQVKLSSQICHSYHTQRPHSWQASFAGAPSSFSLPPALQREGASKLAKETN